MRVREVAGTDPLVTEVTQRQKLAMIMDPRVTANHLPLNALYVLSSKGVSYIFDSLAHISANAYDRTRVR
jgi:hypothetical protein